MKRPARERWREPKEQRRMLIEAPAAAPGRHRQPRERALSGVSRSAFTRIFSTAVIPRKRCT
jgi:hypothetical protein